MHVCHLVMLLHISVINVIMCSRHSARWGSARHELRGPPQAGSPDSPHVSKDIVVTSLYEY